MNGKLYSPCLTPIQPERPSELWDRGVSVLFEKRVSLLKHWTALELTSSIHRFEN